MGGGRQSARLRAAPLQPEQRGNCEVGWAAGGAAAGWGRGAAPATKFLEPGRSASEQASPPHRWCCNHPCTATGLTPMPSTTGN